MSSLSDTRAAINIYSGSRLANIARVDIPSSYITHGVTFLSGVRDAVLDYDDLTDDALHEIAGGAVPVYNIDIMRTLVDLAAWDEDTIELVQPSATILEMSQAALYGVAYRLASALKDELDTAAGEDNG